MKLVKRVADDVTQPQYHNISLSVSLSPGVHPILPEVLILLCFVVLFLSCLS